MWNDHLYGGWLAYHGVSVFWDGRNDCYPSEVFSAGIDIAFLRDGWEKQMDDWQITSVLTRREALAEALEKRGWKLVASQGEILLLERD